jgi:hypothetical protein
MEAFEVYVQIDMNDQLMLPVRIGGSSLVNERCEYFGLTICQIILALHPAYADLCLFCTLLTPCLMDEYRNFRNLLEAQIYWRTSAGILETAIWQTRQHENRNALPPILQRALMMMARRGLEPDIWQARGIVLLKLKCC